MPPKAGFRLAEGLIGERVWRFVQTCRSLWGDGCEVFINTSTAIETQAELTEGNTEMTKFDTTNRGEFYREEDKKNPKGPDYTGTLDVNGVPHRLAGWIKTSKKSEKKFLSLAIEPKKTKAKDAFDDDFQI
jgi:hypothetical protein